MSDFKERNLQCIIAILKKQNPATTKEIMAMRDLFPDLCAGCSSGGDVILAGKELVEQGIVERKWTSAGFAWKLISDIDVKK
ncbi:MAG: hypothetical protein ACXABK_01855 [Candidatus Heimdallarchaeaceae archaeon]|jgi:hypothetical protein